jgi:hypothetical protein
MKNKMNIVLKSLSLITGIFIIVLNFLTGGVILGESYNIFDPYADTEMAKEYTPDKFKLVKERMSMNEIKKLVGEPIFTNYDTLKSLTGHYYTSDGYLRKRNDRKFALISDIAWYGSSLEYNKDSIAIKVYSGWYYD